MSIRTDLIKALNGEVPEHTPFSIYDWFFEGGGYSIEGWQTLFDQGLGRMISVHTVRHIEQGVENQVDEWVEGGRIFHRHRKITPIGVIQNVLVNGWHYEEWIKTPQDYQTLRWIVDHTELAPDYEVFYKAEEQLGENGIVVVDGSRTPAMQILVDWAGTERFCINIAEDVDELMELYRSMEKLFIEETHLIAKGPGRFVRWLENLTVSTLGPRRYTNLLLNIYNQAVPILELAGKRVMVHYDGELRNIALQISEAPFHIIESLTEPPEGNMFYNECRAAWPDKAFWANISLEHYARPPEELAQIIIEKRRRAGKRGLAFEISEDIPPNWRTAVPVVLQTLLKVR
jgi:hypothetical protein